jgi:hypothetical protein
MVARQLRSRFSDRVFFLFSNFLSFFGEKIFQEKISRVEKIVTKI